MPLLHLLAGSNGAGKSTYARDVLIPATGLPFINADEIALERWPDAQAEHAYEAARIAETRRRERIAHQRSFITETVFSHPSKVKLVSDAVDVGYLVHLHIFIVPVELSVQRVTERVRRGGHAVPEEKIRARYERVWTHLATAIDIADVVDVFDNGSARIPFRPCARFTHGTLIGPASWPKWAPPALTNAGGTAGHTTPTQPDR